MICLAVTKAGNRCKLNAAANGRCYHHVNNSVWIKSNTRYLVNHIFTDYGSHDNIDELFFIPLLYDRLVAEFRVRPPFSPHTTPGYRQFLLDLDQEDWIEEKHVRAGIVVPIERLVPLLAEYHHPTPDSSLSRMYDGIFDRNLFGLIKKFLL